MFVNQTGDFLRAKISATLGDGIEKCLAHQRAELVSQPRGEWNAEAHLAAAADARREQISKGGAENALAAHGTLLEADRHRGGKFHNAMVQQRLPAFQAVGHRGDVDLHQQIARQIGRQIG